MTLDSIGNHRAISIDGGQPTSYGFDSQNEQTDYQGTTLIYDDAGDMRRRPKRHYPDYQYDAWGRMWNVSPIGGVAFRVRCPGRRILNDSIERSLISGNQVIEDRHTHGDGFGNAILDSIDRQVWGTGYIDQMVLRDHFDVPTSATTRTYSLQDANYNTVAITNSTGVVQDTFAYDQNGGIRSRSGTDNWVFLWQGLIQVTVGSGPTATTMYDGRSRFYDVALGVWISHDHGGYIDGMSTFTALITATR